MSVMTARDLVVPSSEQFHRLSDAAKLLSGHRLGGVPLAAHDGTIVELWGKRIFCEKSLKSYPGLERLH
jgi:hypothetical protein